MSIIDWIIMLGTLLGIVAYGVWKTRNISSVKSYLLGDQDLPWWTIGLSVMATQASAITFLSTPGQAYESGMGFAQFYFGLPVAMVFLCIFVLPIFYKLKVYTAYEYLETRFDLKTRTLTAVFFLLQRGLAAGITIYAPAIILSTILGWGLNTTIFFIGLVVIFYTVMGGTKAVSVTQKQQMIVILGGMIFAAIVIVLRLPEGIGFSEAVNISGKLGKLNVVDFKFDLSNRYNFWSGMIGGVFLFLSYFGADQSQVQRYLSGKSLTESRLGLLFNGILKVPMQFLVLFVGILVFVFFSFVQPPIHFNEANLRKLEGTPMTADLEQLQAQQNTLFLEQREETRHLLTAIKANDEGEIEESQQRISALHEQDKDLRESVRGLILQADPAAKTKDTDYVFITFVMHYLPIGLIGLLLAVIFSAAMSSTSSELNALATSTVIDIYRRSLVKDRSDHHYLQASKFFTILWGVIALAFAVTADLFENLIQAVNIIGSLFYGVILGVFMVAFFQKRVRGKAVFLSAILGEIAILLIFWASNSDIWVRLGDSWYLFKVAYLWLNLIGCFLVMLLSELLQLFFRK
ncbi:MAG TPA: sodium:solute symporter [Saprospiraceae bacterium]|nr:sodium:solute symporter [Saprospiraceae bacterium]HMQ82273.1 sodium:solute symporter [Saprospiraceae bacterium]